MTFSQESITASFTISIMCKMIVITIFCPRAFSAVVIVCFSTTFKYSVNSSFHNYYLSFCNYNSTETKRCQALFSARAENGKAFQLRKAFTYKRDLRTLKISVSSNALPVQFFLFGVSSSKRISLSAKA